MGGKNEEINVFLQLVDRIEIRKNDGYDITIHWRTTAEQFLGRKKKVPDGRHVSRRAYELGSAGFFCFWEYGIIGG